MAIIQKTVEIPADRRRLRLDLVPFGDRDGVTIRREMRDEWR